MSFFHASLPNVDKPYVVQPEDRRVSGSCVAVAFGNFEARIDDSAEQTKTFSSASRVLVMAADMVQSYYLIHAFQYMYKL